MSDSEGPLDFCSPGLCTSVTTSSACSDGYEPDNLLRSDGRGFLAAGFVRPPVSLTFTFCCRATLRQLTLAVSLSQQLTTGADVLVSPEPEGEADALWCKVGSLWQARGREPPHQVTFVDRSAARPGPAPCGAVLRLQSRPDRSLLRRVRRLRLRLTRARGASALCLGSVQAWAVPSEPEHAAFRAVLKERRRKQDAAGAESAGPAPKANGDAGKPEAVRTRLERLGAKPPDEFLDAITCEVMVLPMVLPSGHTVDQSTLDRNQRAEAVWGRPPSDPFSGVAFAAGAHPVPDAALKARIDHFLFQHAGKSVELASVGRTVGRRAAVAAKRPPLAGPQPPRKLAALNPPAKEAGGGAAAGSDLDSALQAALSGLASFRPRAAPAPPPETAPVCCRCAGTSSGLYSVPCGHAVCRDCLLQLPKTGQCQRCRAQFNRSDAVRLHS